MPIGLAPVAPSSLCPGVPQELDELVYRAMHPDPSARFESIAELRAAIE